VLRGIRREGSWDAIQLLRMRLYVMKSRDILSPDIGPGIRTQDSVVTSGTTASYAAETVSSLIQLRGVTGSCTAGYHGILGSNPGADIRR